ncbi:MAG: 16S rRNA (uracil(1498)-N(3))-methyltransferase [Oscillospiraceae bacterium]|nr:16S rRNA (uracil(1498)-N(3))-methyltransferase [Oscillospiraceae bacterium]
MDLIELWRYPRFFVENGADSRLTLSEQDLYHARQVLRMKNGDKAILCDGNGTDYLSEYREYFGSGERSGVRFEVIRTMTNQAEPTVKLRLFQCLPKSDKMDFIVQKAVELGVSEVIPTVSARCISRPSGKSAANKTARWNKIAYEAAKQCGRGRIPVVGQVLNFKKAAEGLNKSDLSIIFYECGGERLNKIFDTFSAVSQINLFIGSEGGFETGEVELLRKAGAIPATLGKRILRVDTASIAAVSLIMNLSGNI